MSVTAEKSNKRVSILGYPLDLVNMESALDIAENYIKSAKSAHIITLNPEMIMQSANNPVLDEAIKNAELIIPDGIGIILTLRKLGIYNIEQLPGIEFSYNLIQKCVKNNYRVGFLGASKEVIECMIQEFTSKHPSMNIVFVRDGYFNTEQELGIVEDLKSSGVQVLFVALGVPKQELWIKKYKEVLDTTVMVGVGGSFDVWAKKVKRAPLFFRKIGLEWFFRLISQPSRFSRMFPVLPLFFIKVMLDKKYTRKES